MNTAAVPKRPVPATVIPVQWPSESAVTDSGIEILREPWSLVKREHCPACGAKATVWMAGHQGEQHDETWRMCVACGTAYQFAVQPRAAGTGFLGVILEQLRIALGFRTSLALLK